MSEPSADADRSPPSPRPAPACPRSADAFARALDELAAAAPFAKARYQTEVFRLATELLGSDEGIAALRAQAPRFDAAGVFHGGPWERADRLLPELVGTGLRGEGQYPTVEALSELRLLAVAAGESRNEDLSAAEASDFLRSVMGLNLDLLYGERDTEEARLRPRVLARARRVLERIQTEIPAEGFLDSVIEEIEARAAQRPIRVDVLRDLIRQASAIPPEGASEEARTRLAVYARAIDGPTEVARACTTLVAYRDWVRNASDEERAAEAQAMGRSLHETGLASAQHAVLLRCLRKDAERVCDALGLGDAGRADVRGSPELTRNLVGAAIHPATHDAIYGFSQLLERSLLSRPEVASGLAKLVELDLKSEVRAVLLEDRSGHAGVTANAVLVAGAMAMLGLPLGVGQGANPTCQAARGLSLWSLHAPGYLLELLVAACRDGTVEISFEGQPLRSDQLGGGVAKGVLDPKLDPVSRVLVPHLDRLYDEMMRRASLRGQDAHKWVNPALYGRWVPSGFTSIFDVTGTQVVGYETFLRLFYATHHPAYGDDTELIYPNPVGILVTDVHGNLLGHHAVSIQRVASDGAGELRVYFFNPNNEGRQRWGGAVEPTVRGHDELPGESSLPFSEFACHLYAFHYNPYEVGDPYAVPDETVRGIQEHVQGTWGASYGWGPAE